MRHALRYLRLLWVQLRSSLLLALQYRWDFLTDGAISALYAVTAVAPLWVVFAGRDSIAGWTAPEALLVGVQFGWVTAMALGTMALWKGGLKRYAAYGG